MLLLDSDKLLETGTRVNNTQDGFERSKKRLRLPEYVKNVNSSDIKGFYQEVNPSLNTIDRNQCPVVSDRI